jgi:hypothetical protein
VIHEIVSKIVHLDVHVVPPATDRDYYFLFTTGMSSRPMAKPPEAPGSQFAELSLALPSSWRFDRQIPRWMWPILELKSAALLPHRSHSWLGPGHTMVSDPPKPFDASTRFSSLLVVEPALLPPDARTIHTGGLAIDLLSVRPLYPEELEYRFDHGVDALVDSLGDVGASDVIDPSRPSAARDDDAAFMPTRTRDRSPGVCCVCGVDETTT